MIVRTKLAQVIARMHSDRAQDLLEYALLASLIALVAMGAVTAVGNQLDTVLWQAISAMV